MLISLAVGTILLQLTSLAVAEPIVFCYYTNWSQYRPGVGKYVPENVDPFLCTHIGFAFAKFTNGLLDAYEWNDLSTEWSKGMYERTMALKRTNSKLKVLLAIGGWNLASYDFSTMVHSAERRRAFITHSIRFLKSNGFDGLDLDWEYPSNREGSQPDDRELFTILVQEMRDAYNPHGLLLTAAVAAGKSNIDTAYEIPKISQNFDFINLMSYDLHGSWENFVGGNAPLYSRADETAEQSLLNVKWAVEYWISKGAPSNKLVLGLPTYGRSFELVDSTRTKPGSPARSAGIPGRFTREAGFLSYYEICELRNTQNWAVEFNEEQRFAYSYKDNQWVGYDTADSLKEKVYYAMSKNLAGIMFWSLDLDDFDGSFCNQGKYPLINAAKSALSGYDGGLVTNNPPVIDKTTNNLIFTTKKTVTTSQPTAAPITNSSQELDCSNGDGYYALKSTKCRNYYVCEFTNTPFAKTTIFSCPVLLVFDVIHKICNYESLVKC